VTSDVSALPTPPSPASLTLEVYLSQEAENRFRAGSVLGGLE